MPSLARITSTFFTGLINRLGIRPPFPEGFEMSNVVQPVSIVDSDISFSAVQTSQLLDTPFTAGVLAAPAANTVLADSGALAEGNYQVYCLMSAADGTAGASFNIQRRNAANAANIWEQALWGIGSGPVGQSGIQPVSFRVFLAAGERIRITNRLAGGAGSAFQASLWISPVT